MPPRKVIEILATDDDDRSKGNGPPFYFRLDPNADDEIRASFKIEHDPSMNLECRNVTECAAKFNDFHSLFTEGANGDGMAIVSSLRSFDREQQKEFHVPIVIKDSGNPAMSGTSTLTVIIGDVNDNKMQAGSKDIFVYNYMVSFEWKKFQTDLIKFLENFWNRARRQIRKSVEFTSTILTIGIYRTRNSIGTQRNTRISRSTRTLAC
jgi:hypothetical protein